MNYWILLLGTVLVFGQSFTLSTAASSAIVSYYCGFSSDYCGQSQSDDVYSNTVIVIMAWGKVGQDGALSFDTAHFPRNQVRNWKNSGKRVMISVGGTQPQTWKKVLVSNTSRSLFVSTTASLFINEGLDGIDLYIEGDYSFSPKQFADLIQALYARFARIPGNQLISLTTDGSGIYAGAPVPDQDKRSQPYNFVTALYKLANNAINFYQVRVYSHWYDGLEVGSLDYLKDVYLQWSNLPSPFCVGCIPIGGFTGIPKQKLIILVVASSEVRKKEDYYSPSILRSFKNWMRDKGYQIYGFAIWNSYWDSKNGYQIPQAIAS